MGLGFVLSFGYCTTDFLVVQRAMAAIGVAALLDVTPELFEARTGLDTATARRARHVITENGRTLAAADAMCHGDASTLGLLMNESHKSLRDDVEVSSPALDTMVEIAQAQPGCHGARMTGAGFGGCAVALVDRDQSAAFVECVAAMYERRIHLVPQLYVSKASAGAAAVLLDA
jgi:galactokinase